MPKVYTTWYRNPTLTKDHLVYPISLGLPKFALPYLLQNRLFLLAPPREILKMAKQSYELRYYAHLDRKAQSIFRLMNGLARNAGERPIILACFEDLRKQGEWCHRRMFAEWFRNRSGDMIPELPVEEKQKSIDWSGGGGDKKADSQEEKKTTSDKPADLVPRITRITQLSLF